MTSLVGKVELQYDSDGIWLVDVTYRDLPDQLGHIPWAIIAIYIKEWLVHEQT